MGGQGGRNASLLRRPALKPHLASCRVVMRRDLDREAPAAACVLLQDLCVHMHMLRPSVQQPPAGRLLIPGPVWRGSTKHYQWEGQGGLGQWEQDGRWAAHQDQAWSPQLGLVRLPSPMAMKAARRSCKPQTPFPALNENFLFEIPSLLSLAPGWHWSPIKFIYNKKKL
jgi:hypothetical protein